MRHISVIRKSTVAQTQKAPAPSQANKATEDRRVSSFVLGVYAFPAIATQFVLAPVFTVLPGIFTIEFGMSASAVGIAIIIMRLWDAISDPFVGYTSDRLRTRFGRRKPYIAFGAVLACIGAWLLFVPPAAPTMLSVAAFGIVFFLGWTMIEIPHTAWGTELTRHPADRTKLFLYRSLAGVFGGLIFAVLPFTPWNGTPEITSRTMTLTFIVFAALIVVTTSAALIGVPHTKAEPSKTPSQSITKFIASLRDNAPFWRFLVAFMAIGVGIGLFGTLQFIYLASYLGYKEEVSIVLGVGFLSSLISLPVWYFLIQRLGKPRAWCVGMAFVALFMVPVAFVPAGPQFFPVYLSLSLGVTLSAGAGIIVPFALLGDIIDYDTLKTQTLRSGLYTAFFLLIVKANGALGGGAGLLALDWVGFDPASETHSSTAILGFKLLFTVLPAMLILIGVVIMWRFPIDQRRHHVIRLRLDQLDARNGHAQV